MADNCNSLDEYPNNVSSTVEVSDAVISLAPVGKRGKRDRLSLREDAGLLSSHLLSRDSTEENNKKFKHDSHCESNDECISFPNSNFQKKNIKKLHRNYRPRVMESSSEDEAVDINCPSTNGAKMQASCADTVAEPAIPAVNSSSANNNKCDIDKPSVMEWLDAVNTCVDCSDISPGDNPSDKAASSNQNKGDNSCKSVIDEVQAALNESSKTDITLEAGSRLTFENEAGGGESYIKEPDSHSDQRETSHQSGGQMEMETAGQAASEAQSGDQRGSESQPEGRRASDSQSGGQRGSESQAATQRRRRRFFRGFLDTDTEDSMDDDNEEEEAARRERNEERASRRAKLEEEVASGVKKIMEIQKPKHNWNSVIEIWNRQFGAPGNRQSSVLFKNRYYDSLHVVQRLELMNKLEYHQGCANALCFDSSGDLLASGSDDLQIAVWDWCREKTNVTYNSGHRNNVFQCKFLPLSGNTHIVSCARDGQVRLAELSASGVCKDTRRLAKHSRSAHKLAARLSTPYEIMSAGEDAVVYNIDIRVPQPDKIVLVKDVHGSRVPLYSIHSHPLNDDQFCVCGQDEYVRVYDRRIISTFGPPVIKYCPNRLVESKPKPNITCAVYSNNGDAILASYNNEDIYLFDTNLSEGAEYIHRYSGHRNSSTVKGVNFFSPSSKYIVSGSDCGNIFYWDRETECIVNCMPGDENGVVNVLEPHPHLPIIATSGLDNDIKVWIPSFEEEPKLNDLPQTVKSNMRHRLHETNDDQGLETHMLMLLFQHLRRNPVVARRRASGGGGGGQSGGLQNEDNNEEEEEYGLVDSSDSSSDNNSDDSDTNREDRVQCSTH